MCKLLCSLKSRVGKVSFDDCLRITYEYGFKIIWTRCIYDNGVLVSSLVKQELIELMHCKL